MPNVFCVWNGFEYTIFFWIGFEIRKKKLCRKCKMPVWLWIVGYALLYTFCEAFSGVDLLLIKVLMVPARLLKYSTGAIMAFAALQKIANQFGYQNNQAFLFLSKRTMPIYLFHQPVIYFAIVWFNGVLEPYIHSIVNFTVSLSASILVSSLLLRSKKTRFLIGDK